MHWAINQAAIELLAARAANSASLMAIAPYFDDAIERMRAAGISSAGVHLALEAEFPALPMRPSCDPAEVSSLVDEHGMFYRDISPVCGRFDAQEVRRELSAQIERVAQAGIRLTHLDGHMFFYDRPGTNPELLRIVTELGVSYGLPVRSCNGPIVMIWDGYDTIGQRREAYRALFRDSPGIECELIIHPGSDEQALREFTSRGERRIADYLVFRDDVPLWRAACRGPEWDE